LLGNGSWPLEVVSVCDDGLDYDRRLQRRYLLLRSDDNRLSRRGNGSATLPRRYNDHTAWLDYLQYQRASSRGVLDNRLSAAIRSLSRRGAGNGDLNVLHHPARRVGQLNEELVADQQGVGGR
jgi:hypothetical protein